MRANMRQIPNFIANRTPFRGNSMSGIVPSGRDRDGDSVAHMGRLFLHPTEQAKFRGRELDYIVLSYDTPIAAIAAEGDVIVVEAKFSPTTSRHQSAAADGFRSVGLL